MKQHPKLQRRRRKSHWLPDYIALTVSDINFDYLKAAGIKACLVDLDDTIVPRHSLKVDRKTKKILRSQPLSLFIATNRPVSRDLKDLAKQIKANGIIQPKGIHGKPSKKYFRSATKIVGIPPGQLVMIGDHIFQDIWGANRSGLKTIAVAKFAKNNWPQRLSGLHDELIFRLLAKKYQQLS